MARTNDRERSSKRATKEARPRGKKRVCLFCKDHAEWVDYKDVNLLRRFMSDRGKIRSRRVTGNCTQHQRDVQSAIKTARELALLPYVQRTVNERGPSRRLSSAPLEEASQLPAGTVPDQEGEGFGVEELASADGAKEVEE